MSDKIWDALVIGGGPAGLSASAVLKRRNIDHLVLEKGSLIGHSWRRYYQSLRLHTGKHLSYLPQKKFSSTTSLFPSRDEFIEYLDSYQKALRLPICTNCTVKRARPNEAGWTIETTEGAINCHRLVMATGIASSPSKPNFEGQETFKGKICHSIEYQNEASYKNKKVLVVGVGNSGGEIASELSRVASKVVLSVRSGANILPLRLMGIPTQYFGLLINSFPKTIQRSVIAGMGLVSRALRGSSPLPRKTIKSECPDFPLIGYNLVNAIKDGRVHVRPGLLSFQGQQAIFADKSRETLDNVILATGFRATLDILDGVVERDPCGFASRFGRILSADHTNLVFMGQNYDSLGGLYNIRKDAQELDRWLSLEH